MPLVGFEPTIPAFERAKTVHALDRAATVIGHKRTILATKLVWSRDIFIFASHTKLNNQTGKGHTFLSWNLLTLVSYHDHYRNAGREHLYQRCKTTPCCKRKCKKKFWEELMAYFPLIRHGLHRKRRLQQYFVAAGMSLPNCYLTMQRGIHRLSFDKTQTGEKMTRPTILLLLRVFVVAGTSLPICYLVTMGGFNLPSLCLATIGGYTYRHTDWWEEFMK
jgi:hypothetical protein